MAALGHDGLFTLANKVHAAAVDADPERLEQAARRFADALSAHLEEEAAAVVRLAPPQARIVYRGQLRIVDRTRALIEHARSRCASGGGRCSIDAEELLALLVLQARDEGRLCSEPAA